MSPVATFHLHFSFHHQNSRCFCFCSPSDRSILKAQFTRGAIAVSKSTPPGSFISAWSGKHCLPRSPAFRALLTVDCWLFNTWPPRIFLFLPYLLLLLSLSSPSHRLDHNHQTTTAMSAPAPSLASPRSSSDSHPSNYLDIVRCSRCQRSLSIQNSSTPAAGVVQFGMNSYYCSRCATMVGFNNRWCASIILCANRYLVKDERRTTKRPKTGRIPNTKLSTLEYLYPVATDLKIVALGRRYGTYFFTPWIPSTERPVIRTRDWNDRTGSLVTTPGNPTCCTWHDASAASSELMTLPFLCQKNRTYPCTWLTMPMAASGYAPREKPHCIITSHRIINMGLRHMAIDWSAWYIVDIFDILFFYRRFS